MEYSVEVIKNAVERFINDEYIEDISKDIGVATSTIYSWLTPENCPKDEESLKALSKRIKELIRQKKFSEARIICENFIDNEIICSQLVTILIGQGELKAAKEICNKFKNQVAIQSQLVTILLKQGNIPEAKKICEDFKDDDGMQSQLINILRKEGNISEIKKICERFKDSEILQFQLLMILMDEGDLKAAKEICNRFKDTENIQRQLPRILIRENKYKSIGTFFVEEISQIRDKAQEKREANDNSYVEDLKKLDLISRRTVGDLRARMELVLLLKKYGLNDFVEKQLHDENEIYQEMYRLILFAKDNPNYNRGKLVKSKLVQGIKNKIISNGGNTPYAFELIDKAIKREPKEQSR
jgi:hypothetical protein